jgi:hypothetical protein
MPIDGLNEICFQNTVSLGLLRIPEGLAQLAQSPGVYIVHRPDFQPVVLQEENTGGWFHGLPPGDFDRARAKWIEDARVLYIGKTQGNHGLRGRVRRLVQFGQGLPVAHRGGRLLWHIADPWTLLCLSWFECPHARDVEKVLILAFERVYGRLTFANLQH